MFARSSAITFIAGSLCASLPVALGQERANGEKLHMVVYLEKTPLRLSANAIDREAPTLNWTPSVIHLKGDVEIRMPYKQLTTPDAHLYMVIHTDEADFSEKTQDLQLRGNTHITVEPAK